MARFFLGFAAGVLALAILLLAAGRLRNQHTGEASRSAPESRITEHASDLPQPSRALPDTTQQPPQAPVQVPPPAVGNQQPGFDRRLLFPVPGVDPRSLTDTFSDTRSGGRRHEAQDIMAPRGTPVLAVDEGNVVKLFTSKQGGLTVYQFDDSRTWCYYYAHLDSYAPGLREGMLLRRGDRIGSVGSTGDVSADAPHLHFAVSRLGPEKRWWEGTPLDAFPLLRDAMIGSKCPACGAGNPW
jgi:peptidoglycan LD-endopeptidase LytH